MTYANLYAIFFGIFVIWFSFSSVCSSVLDNFAGDAFVAGDTNKIDTGGKIDKVIVTSGGGNHLTGCIKDGYAGIILVDDHRSALVYRHIVRIDRTDVSRRIVTCLRQVHRTERRIPFGSGGNDGIVGERFSKVTI